MPSKNSTPSYRLHKPTGQAVVRLNGRDFYLGRHGTPESRAEYDRLISEWLSSGRRFLPPGDAAGNDLTVAELALAFLAWADGYYRKAGRPTGETVIYRAAIKPLRELYGHTLARDFGPKALKAVRARMIEAGLCRQEINRRVGKLRRVFRWGVAEEIVPPSVAHALAAVDPLSKGRTAAREAKPIRPVPDEHVDAVLPFLSRQVRTMVELQRLTGMRPGEVIAMTTADVDTTGPHWVYRPRSHKTEHHHRDRAIILGPRARRILGEWFRPDSPDLPLFSPADAEGERRAAQRAARKSAVQPSQKGRSKANPKKRPGQRYTADSYRKAILYGIQRANREAGRSGADAVPDWHPNQLRHSAATRFRAEFGLDVARAVLGHASLAMADHYAELDLEKAATAVNRIG